MRSASNLFKLMRPRAVLWAIMIAASLIELGLLSADAGLIASSRLRGATYANGGFWIGLLGDWQPNFALQPYTMFITYGFLHIGIFHLGVNMITLFALGQSVIARVGQSRFLILFILATMCGAGGFALLSDVIQPMVGASGALFGLAGAIAAWEYVDRYTARLRLWPVLRLVLFLVALNWIMFWAMNGLLAWQTHLGGFVGGWIVALLVDPRSRPVSPPDNT